MKYLDNSREVMSLVKGNSRKAMTLALNAGKKNAEEIVPVRTGALKDSINTEMRNGPDGSVIGILEATKEYAWFVENGTSKQSAQPFIEPSLNIIETILKDSKYV